MTNLIPPDQFPTYVVLGPGVHALSWYGTVVQSYYTRSQAKSALKYLKFWLRRLAKAQLLYNAELCTQLGQFLSNSADPAKGFDPPFNVI